MGLRGLIFVALVMSCGGKQSTASSQGTDTPTERPLLCDVADPASCDLEGMRFENAVGRSRSMNDAARHYAAACRGGFGPGCTHLAGMYFEKEAYEDAHQLYRQACEHGDNEGCANLGFMASRAGEIDAARELYTTACEAGSMSACENLAAVHQAGRGVSVDHDTAQSLFGRACAGGQASSCIRRSWSLARGCREASCAASAETERQAAEVAGHACEEGAHPTVCTGFAVHLESGRLVPKDSARARSLYTAACAAEEAWGCERLGHVLSRGLGGPRELTASASAYEKACEADFAPGCSALGAMLLAGQGEVARDEARGAALLKRACELHEVRSCNTLRLLGL